MRVSLFGELDGLSKAQPIRPQLALDLNRMVMQRHSKPCEDILSVEHAVVRFQSSSSMAKTSASV